MSYLKGCAAVKERGPGFDIETYMDVKFVDVWSIGRGYGLADKALQALHP